MNTLDAAAEEPVLDLDRYAVLTFDCYGTLIDWERGILTALHPLLAAHGVRLTDDQILEQFGELEAAIEAGPYRRYRDVLAAVADGFAEAYDFTISDVERTAFSGSVPNWPPFPDSPAALESLAQHYRLVVLSNVDDDLFAGSAAQLGVAFDDVITAQQVGSYKPNPRNFQVAIERVGLPKERILHVAQSLFHDIAPARDAGLTTVWINRRHDRAGFGATPPAAATPDLELPDMASLARLVDEGRGKHG